MDATPFYKLARLAPIALVCLLITTPQLLAESQAARQKAASASGSLVLIPTEKPKSAGSKTDTRRTQGHTWKHSAAKRQHVRPDISPAKVAPKLVQPASYEEKVVVAPKPRRKAPAQPARRHASQVAPTDSTAKMLVRAHELSQRASTAEEYQDIAVICETAERLGLSGEQLEFALQLHTWAIKHSDQARIKHLEQQLRTEKAAQQLRTKQSEQKLQVQRAKQRLQTEKVQDELLAKKLEQRLRAEQAEEQLQAAKIQQQLGAEIAKLRERAERAERQLAINQTELQQVQESLENAPPVAIAIVSGADDQNATIADEPEPQVVEPQKWQQLHNRGVTFAEQGKYAEALDDFTQVIDINPMFPKAYANRATLFTQSGDLEQAQADYERACDLDPELLPAQLGLGRVYHLLGQTEQALDCFDRALELNPDSADIVCSRGDLLADVGRYRDALADYAQAIDLNPEFAHAYRNGSWLLATCPDRRFRDPINAVRGAEQALEFDYGDRHITLDTLAAAHASSGDFELAIEKLQEAIETAPHESRIAYRERLRQYQDQQPFYTEPVEDVSQAVYEVSDR
jgi:tetratricopeptide (TPR) repeat protein